LFACIRQSVKTLEIQQPTSLIPATELEKSRWLAKLTGNSRRQNFRAATAHKRNAKVKAVDMKDFFIFL